MTQNLNLNHRKDIKYQNLIIYIKNFKNNYNKRKILIIILYHKNLSFLKCINDIQRYPRIREYKKNKFIQTLIL